MAESSGHDRPGRNKYDRSSKYESDRKNAGTSDDTSPPRAAVPATTDQFQPRNLPTPTLYNPIFGGRRRDRRRAQEHIDALRIATEVAGAAEVLEGSLTKVEEAHQQRELVQLRRGQLPAKIELENLDLGNKLLAARTGFEAAAERQQDERIQRERDRRLDDEDFEIALAKRHAELLEAQAQERAAAAYAAQADEIGKRRAEAELHKASETAFEKEADAERERRRRDQERHKRGQETADPTEYVPAALRTPLKVVDTVAESREWIEGKIAKIKSDADAAGRPLTRQDIEKIDQYQDALDQGESSIRRQGASDL
jgi:hypothetical protein